MVLLGCVGKAAVRAMAEMEVRIVEVFMLDVWGRFLLEMVRGNRADVSLSSI
jgi:hypothetical protein